MNEQLAMVIEDSEDLCTIYGTAIKGLYPQISNIRDGKEAMEQLDIVIPALIILDMNLPRVPGTVIYKRIRADSRFAQTPVIIATANIVAADTLKNEIDHLDRIMVKPVSPRQLRQMVETIKQSMQN